MRWGLGKSQSLALVPFPPNLVCAFLHTGPAVHLSRLSLTSETAEGAGLQMSDTPGHKNGFSQEDVVDFPYLM